MMTRVQHLKQQHASSASCSQDVLFHDILTRVPVKSVVRFKSVSKGWLERIRSNKFIALHGSKSEPRPSICITVQRENQVILFTADLCSTKTVSFVQNSMFTRDKPPALVDLGDVKDINIKFRPINGLTCLYNFDGDICIYNLTTREKTPWVVPPFIKEAVEDERTIHILPHYRFGFDPIKKEYKVLCIGKVTTQATEDYADYDEETECNVLTVSSGGEFSWKEWDAHYVLPCMLKKDGVYANGCIFWIEQIWSAILAFTVGDEEITELSFPEEFHAKEEVNDNYDLIQVDGRIAVIKRVSMDTIKLWKLVDDDMEKWKSEDANNLWSKETITLDSSPLSKRLMKESRFKFLSIPETNLIIIMAEEIRPRQRKVVLKCYDWNLKTFEEIDISGIVPLVKSDCTYALGGYLETLSHV